MTELLRKIKRILRLTKKTSKIKGHELIMKHESLIFSNINDNEYIIEIGSDRDAGSTYYIALLANRYNLNFITVDIDEKATSRAGKIISKINKNFMAINDFGENFLREFSGSIRLAYLDAFDIPGNWHSRETIQSYADKNLQITLDNCHKMHYECAVSLAQIMPVNSFICFDDVNPIDDQNNLIFDKVSKDYKKWSGKGALAIPFLLENDFEVIDNKRACALLRKTKPEN